MWKKSNYSGASGECLEVWILSKNASEIHVRDSKKRQGSTLSFTASAWSRFVRTVTLQVVSDYGDAD